MKKYLVGIIIFCIIGSEFFMNYKVVFRESAKKKLRKLEEFGKEAD